MTLREIKATSNYAVSYKNGANSVFGVGFWNLNNGIIKMTEFRVHVQSHTVDFRPVLAADNSHYSALHDMYQNLNILQTVYFSVSLRENSRT